MKKIKVLFVAMLALVMAQGVWAAAPGITPGGGTTASQAPQPGAMEQSPAGPVMEDVAVMDEGASTTTQPEAAVETPAIVTKDAPATESVAEEAPAQVSKKSMRQEMKAALKASRTRDGVRTPHAPMAPDQLVCVIVALFIPWLGVLLWFDGITKEFWITLLLWFLFILPGLIYALYVILS